MVTTDRDAPTSHSSWRVEVRVLPKRGVNDPQGDAVRTGLHALGFSEAGTIRCGKLVVLDVAAPDAESAEHSTRRMCDRLLANPVIEDYEVTVLALNDSGGGEGV